MVRKEPYKDLLPFRLGQVAFRVNGAIDGDRLGDTRGVDLESTRGILNEARRDELRFCRR